jgi:ATP-dependent RNA helicase RhlE
MPELYMHRIGRMGSQIKRYCNHFIAPREEDKVEVEVLMNMELAIEEFPAEVEVSKPIELEKERSS